MIGNDIVDLAQAKRESNWRRTGFLDKVFTAYEQQLIRSASDPDRMVWLLWSMKESAYKLVTRQSGKRVFAPKQLTCQLLSTTRETLEGSVSYAGISYKTTSPITDQYVATVAYSTLLSAPVNQVIIPFDSTTYQNQQSAIRVNIKQQVATHLFIPESAIHIHKNESGVPFVTIGDAVNMPISLSHHGHYGAYVLNLPPQVVQ